MTDTIIISKSLQLAMIDHARAVLPNECCGYITGVNNECKTLHKMTNVDASPVHFSFDPKEQFGVIKAARQVGQKPLVVYHSHPESPARLSNEDRRLLKDPEMVYAIVSLEQATSDIKAYRIVDGTVTQVKIKETI
ncbi:MAG: M67 family metallopeptidase [Candidatus Marinamargulisbacteria bacterium]